MVRTSNSFLLINCIAVDPVKKYESQCLVCELAVLKLPAKCPTAIVEMEASVSVIGEAKNL